MRLRRLTIMVVTLVLIVPVHKLGHAQLPEARAYYLGFTPLPYEFSWQAITQTYEAIGRDADLIAHHFDVGVPWPEALAGQPYSQHIQDDWQVRRNLTPAGHQVFVTLAPLNITRDGLAPYRGDQDAMPLPAPWDSYTFNHPDVKAAFLSYAQEAIRFFQPDYLCIGPEVNALIQNVPDQWPAYLELHRYVYTSLKADYPDLPIFASFIGLQLVDGYTDANIPAQQAGLQEALPYNDLFALSLYPYLTGYLADAIPTQMFDDLRQLTDKPMAVAETGYPAQPFDAEVDGINYTFRGSPEKQAQYITLLLQAAQRYQFEFVVNFVLRDYDTLAEQIGTLACQFCPLFQDTGLIDEQGNPRPALTIWLEALVVDVE